MQRAEAPALSFPPVLSSDAIVAPVAGIDPRVHALTPLQTFVLAHVDGRRSIGELSKATGVSTSAITTWLGRLVEGRVLRLLPSPPRASAETRLVSDEEMRDSNRPTVPGVAADLLEHERPTRPVPT